MEQEDCVTCGKEVLVKDNAIPKGWMRGELTLGEGAEEEDIHLYVCSDKCAMGFWNKNSEPQK